MATKKKRVEFKLYAYVVAEVEIEIDEEDEYWDESDEEEAAIEKAIDKWEEVGKIRLMAGDHDSPVVYGAPKPFKLEFGEGFDDNSFHVEDAKG